MRAENDTVNDDPRITAKLFYELSRDLRDFLAADEGRTLPSMMRDRAAVSPARHAAYMRWLLANLERSEIKVVKR